MVNGTSNVTSTLQDLLTRLMDDSENIQFQEVISTIEKYYDYTPTTFSNGKGDDAVVNAAGTNEGSCKIFAFARLHNLDEEQTLNCFGDYYRVDVLQHPHGTDHTNIRNFMLHGWAGINFQSEALKAKSMHQEMKDS